MRARAVSITLDRPKHEFVKLEPADHVFERFVGTHWEDFQEQCQPLTRSRPIGSIAEMKRRAIRGIDYAKLEGDLRELAAAKGWS